MKFAHSLLKPANLWCGSSGGRIATANDCGLALLVLILGGTAAGANELNSPDGLVGLDVTVRNLAEDDVLAIEPRGYDGGDEKLGAVAISYCQNLHSLAEDGSSGLTCWDQRWPWREGKAECAST